MPKGERFILSMRELSGALGDLGTLLPLMLGTIAVVGLAPLPVVAGFALFYHRAGGILASLSTIAGGTGARKMPRAREPANSDC